MNEEQIRILKKFIKHRAGLINYVDISDLNVKHNIRWYVLGTKLTLSDIDYVFKTELEKYFNKHLRAELRDDNLEDK